MHIISNEKDDLKYRKEQIELFFSLHKDMNERAEYVKSAYPDRYTEVIVDNKRIGYKAQEDGLLMWEESYLSRKSESVFSWHVVSEWLSQLILKNEYHKKSAINISKDPGSI